MGVRLEPHDEYMHELGPEPNFNESMYFNVYDPKCEVGGFFRLGNRANEGTGEMTCCIYLPDGRVGFMFKRPDVHHNDAFDAAGMRFEVVTPFEDLKVDYEGKLVMLDNPLDMADPRAAFTNNPYEECAVHLTYRGLSAMFGGEPEEPHEKPGEEFAKGHYEQLIGGRGTIRVGDHEWEIDGYGLRDHSWGPRYWQAPWYYRWLTANFGEDFGFMGSRIARKDGPGTRGGFVWEDGQLHLCNDFEISTDWVGDDTYHQDITATLRSRDKSWSVTGSVRSLIPLRNRRTTPDGEQLVTRISEGMTEWRLDDGRVGYGLSEYLDQIIDNRPVGVDE
ncbi:MAG TPA: hypothetical protein VGZ52_04415 [Acidimicrobiales bacterium]|jgi:hypothetical protein|nr:hypothetical protein [Acidimicrobiales bacterium]